MMATAQETFGAIDILVNNAVVRHVAAIESMPPDDWDEDLAVNLSAAFHTIRLALPGMKTRNWGRIVNVSSIYGLVGATNRAGYVTTKTALIGLTRAVALETTAYDITCNAVCPGTSATPVHEASLATLRQTQNLDRDAAERLLLAGKQPTGRLIAPGRRRRAHRVAVCCRTVATSPAPRFPSMAAGPRCDQQNENALPIRENTCALVENCVTSVHQIQI